jgi:hypothetical protein
MANLPEADYANLDKLNAAIASDPTFHYLSLHANNGDQQSIQALKDLAASKGFPVPDNVAWDAGSFQNTGGSIPTWMKVAGIGLGGLATLGLAAPALFAGGGGAAAAGGGAEAAGAGAGGATAAGVGGSTVTLPALTGGGLTIDGVPAVGATLASGGPILSAGAGGGAAGAAGGASGGAAGGAAGAGSGFLSGLGKIAGPLISGGFGLAGAALQAHATSDAVKANAQIQQEALDFEKAQLAQKQAALQPYVDTGNQSRGQLAYLLGIGPNNGPNPISTNTPMPAQVQMRDPNGQIESVPASQVAHYQSLGATLVNA